MGCRHRCFSLCVAEIRSNRTRPFGQPSTEKGATLRHESSNTTIQSYVKPEAVAGAQQRRVMTVLEGGQLAS
jgi:hypothetical protein